MDPMKFAKVDVAEVKKALLSREELKACQDKTEVILVMDGEQFLRGVEEHDFCYASEWLLKKDINREEPITQAFLSVKGGVLVPSWQADEILERVKAGQSLGVLDNHTPLSVYGKSFRFIKKGVFIQLFG